MINKINIMKFSQFEMGMIGYHLERQEGLPSIETIYTLRQTDQWVYSSMFPDQNKEDLSS